MFSHISPEQHVIITAILISRSRALSQGQAGTTHFHHAAVSTTYRPFSGPGLLFALSMLGPAGLVSNVTIGSTQRYNLLWVLALVLGFRFVWLDISARYVLVTGESLVSAYARQARILPAFLFLALLTSRHLSNLYKILLMGSAVQLLLPLPINKGAALWSFVFVLAGFALMTKETSTLSRLCRPLIAAMGLAVLIAASLSHPDPRAMLASFFPPSLGNGASGYGSILLITALIGSEAGALVNVSYSYFLLHRKWSGTSFLREQRLDLIVSVGSVFVLDSLLQITAAGTLFPAHLIPRDAEQLVLVFSTVLGVAGRIIFAFGLWAVCFSGFVAGSTGYSLIGADIWRTFFRRESGATSKSTASEQSRKVRLWLVAFWSFSPLYILFTRVQPVWLTLIASSLTALLVPCLAVLLLIVSNDRKRLGTYANGVFSNCALTALILLTFYFSVRNAADLLHRWP